MSDIDQNLYAPLSPQTAAAFEAAGGGELKAQRNRPAKLQSLDSSAALVVNVFQAWQSRDAAPLLAALAIDDSLSCPLAFEPQFSTGLAGAPRNLDVALWRTSGEVVAIESKFTEWMSPQRTKLAPFSEKYLAMHATRDSDGSPGPKFGSASTVGAGANAGLWSNVGLDACQSLAHDIAAGVERFRYLGALQLLKHGLGVATQHPGKFSLVYLFYDWPGNASAAHREEILRFVERVGVELSFRAITYQSFFDRLKVQPGVDTAYRDYLGDRYFAG